MKSSAQIRFHSLFLGLFFFNAIYIIFLDVSRFISWPPFQLMKGKLNREFLKTSPPVGPMEPCCTLVIASCVPRSSHSISSPRLSLFKLVKSPQSRRHQQWITNGVSLQKGKFKFIVLSNNDLICQKKNKGMKTLASHQIVNIFRLHPNMPPGQSKR